MKNAILLHGTGGSDKDYFWFKDTEQYLENQGYQVWWPLLPNTDKPVLEVTLNFIEENIPSINKDTIVIGHSSACPAILYFVEKLKTPIKQIILVGGFYKELDDNGYSKLMLSHDFNWGAIKDNVHNITLINSDNDPWGCNDSQARDTAIMLSATLIVATGQGHMGSGTFNQPYKEFPLLKRAILCE